MMKLIFNNPIQKLLAIGFAVTIWIFAPAPDKYNMTEIQFFVPVSYVNLPKNLGIISEPLPSINLSVEIPRNEIQKFHPSLFQAVVDLDDASPGEEEYELSRNILKKIPPNAKILKISPNSQKLVFEEITEKSLPIKPVFIGELANGYVLKEVKMVPESVTVRGPISKLSKIQQLETKGINIENANSNMGLVVHIAFPEGITVVEPKPEYYASQIKVGSEQINMVFKNLPVGIVNQTYVTRINPRYFNVHLRGPRSLMQNLSKSDIQSFIDLMDLSPGTYKKQPTLRLRPEIQIQKSWPPIDVWVKKQRID
ncbi:MAG: YbbR-like domain-containing protein [Proteobacteria bacterium]|nr:YbbR-like domain-containing protein [Pseudomonadota bacterium]